MSVLNHLRKRISASAYAVVLVIQLDPDTPGHERSPVEERHELHGRNFAVCTSPEREPHQRWTSRASGEIMLEKGEGDHECYSQDDQSDDI